MSEMKTSLQDLIGLFYRSANDKELPMPIRGFAAKLMILTRHIERVEKTNDMQIAELGAHLLSLANQAPPSGAPAANAAAPALPPKEGGDSNGESGNGEGNGEDGDEAFIAAALAEAEREVAAANAAPPPTTLPSVTPLRKPVAKKPAPALPPPGNTGSGDAS
jgi:hypothetical protein